jgi:hypothetical protein
LAETKLASSKTFKLASIAPGTFTPLSLSTSIATITTKALASLTASSLSSPLATLQIVGIYLLPTSSVQVDTVITHVNNGIGNATSLLLQGSTIALSSTNSSRLLLADNTGKAFGIIPSPTQGTMKFNVWVDYTYATVKFTARLAIEVNVTCTPGQQRVSTTGVCADCGVGTYSIINDATVCSPCTDTLTTAQFYSQCVVARSYNVATSALLIALSAFGLAFVIIVAAAFWKFRMTPIIRASSVRFMMILLAGCFLGFITVILIAMPPSNANCLARVWVGHLAYALVFGPLFAKNWRVAQIFDSAQLRSVSITDTFLIKLLAVILSIVIAYMAAWTAVDPPLSVSRRLELDEWQVCDVNSEAWQWIILVLEGIFSGAGVYIVIRARNTPLEFNETNHIAIAVYNIVFVSVVVIPLAFSSVLVSPPSVIVLEGLAMWLSVTVVAAILTVPKLLVLFHIRIGANSSPNTTPKPDAGHTTPTIPGSANGTMMSARGSMMTPTGKESAEGIREQIRILNLRLDQILRPPPSPNLKPGPWTPPTPEGQPGSARRPGSSARGRKSFLLFHLPSSYSLVTHCIFVLFYVLGLIGPEMVYQVDGELKAPDLRGASTAGGSPTVVDKINRQSLSKGVFIHVPTSPQPTYVVAPRSPYGHTTSSHIHVVTSGNASPIPGASGAASNNFAKTGALTPTSAVAGRPPSDHGNGTHLPIQASSATATTGTVSGATSPQNNNNTIIDTPIAGAPTATAITIATVPTTTATTAMISKPPTPPGGLAHTTTNGRVSTVVQSFSSKHDSPADDGGAST